eukprot:TRINITY_DN5247_c0_g2_i2.p1 TRINITY_DN5247_c0_g2~~TRINITY_DN5247_c0_g2_i2.p1  ORF type:complete len:267 (-),score=65.34 TRINITY_DN5247_c0_g2_i2:289-1065(-)
MNTAMKTATMSPQVASMALRAAFFHSTPISDRRRRTHWDSGGSLGGSSKRANCHAKRVRRREAKQTLFRNVSAYADHLFEFWKAGDEEKDQSSSRRFKRQHRSNGTKKDSNSYWESQWSQRNGGFQFCCSDDEEVENMFRSSFGGEKYFYGSFNHAKKFYWTSSSGYSYYRSSWNWKSRTDDEDGSPSDCNSSELALASERQTLGLNGSGPLKLEEVKSAYRACALRWHPDRHQGPAKGLASWRVAVFIVLKPLLFLE